MPWFISLITGLLFSSLIGFSQDPDWKYHARRLTGFSDSTQRASLHALKTNGHLAESLKAALRTGDKYLALDVISTLSLKDFVPVLMPLVATDESGAVALALNTLLTPDTHRHIETQYLGLISNMHRVPLSAPTTMAILDVLARLKTPLSESELQTLMQSPSPWIRSAVLYYARLAQKDSEVVFPEIFRAGLQDSSSLIQEQARTALDGKTLPSQKTGFWDKLFQIANRPAWRLTPLMPPSPKDLLFPRTSSRKISTKAAKACAQTYRQFYDPSEIELHIVFGYKDARPARFVGDRYEAAWFASYLTAPCQAGWNACGFQLEEGSWGTYRKLVAGPDGKSRKIRVRLTYSSAGPDDDENRKDAFQKRITQDAEFTFYEGIRSARAAFYIGHSRDGGGPDFAPPLLTQDKHVDYDWYSKNKPGMKKLIEVLSQTKGTPLVGLFSCASTGHFLKAVQNANRKVATISSPKLIYYSDAMKNLLRAVSALLGQECEADFNTALRARAEVGDSHLNNFFRKN